MKDSSRNQNQILGAFLKVVTSRSALVSVLLLVPSVYLTGCDSTKPEIVEDTIITGVEIELRHPEENRHALATIQGEVNLRAGAVYQADTLVIEPATVYTGRIKIFDSSGTDATNDIRQAAENFQLFYTVTGAAGVELVVTDVESDYGTNEFGADLFVGLVFEVTVAEGVLIDDGKLRVRVGDFGPGVKNGTTLTVEPIVDIVVPFRVEIPPPPPPDPAAPEGITQAVLTLARADGTETWTITAVGVAGLVYVDYDAPNNLNIQRCAIDGSGTLTCNEESTIIITVGMYEGRWDLTNFESGQIYTDEIRTEGDQHQFFYRLNFGPSDLTIRDLDVNGLPVGLSFAFSVPQNVSGSGNLRVRLGHFNPVEGDVKNGQNAGLLEDLRFRIPIVVQ